MDDKLSIFDENNENIRASINNVRRQSFESA